MTAPTAPDEDLYSLRQAAELFGLEESRLRYWAQTGFVGPSVRQRGRMFYTFSDLIGLKVAKELSDSGLPLQRVRKHLDALRAKLPGVERPLAQLRIHSDGEDLVVLADDVAFQPASGQLVMSFAVGTLSSRAATVLPLTRAPANDTAVEPTTAYGCFQAALSAADGAEASDARRAEALYRRALELDPNLASAWTNLGNFLEREGARAQAAEAYEKALALDPDQPEARFNLANLAADRGDVELALAEYRRVVAAVPTLADAHFNMALVLLRVGAEKQARTSLARYLELVPEAPADDEARTLLDSLGTA